MTIDCPQCDEVYNSHNNPTCPGCGIKANIRNTDEANDHYPDEAYEDEEE